MTYATKLVYDVVLEKHVPLKMLWIRSSGDFLSFLCDYFIFSFQNFKLMFYW